MTQLNTLKNANFGKFILFIFFALFGSSQSFAAKSARSPDHSPAQGNPARKPTQVKLAENLPSLPKNIQWVTNDSEPEFASPKAVRGGMLKTFMPQFPMTLRDVGPDANGSFRSYFDQNKLSLLELHPNTRKWIPQLATHWAFDKDNKTIYFKLNPKAKWSDGVPVTADDYVYVLEFMRSKHIVAPWYNNYYTEFYDKVVKYDDHTIAVVGKKPFSEFERVVKYNMGPLPKHFYGELNENFVKDFNWKVAPVTGPYIISEVRKGKYIVFKRVDDWWANNERYYRYRYNIDKLHIKVIRDLNVAYRHFLRGNLDVFAAILPDWWHGRTQGKEYDAGYIVKHWFFNDAPATDMGMWFNTEKGLLKDVRIRKGISYSINVDKVIKSILRNDYERLNSGDQGKGPWYNPKVKAREFDFFY